MSVRNIVTSIEDIMRQDVGVDGDAQRISQICWMFFLKNIDDQDQELELLQPNYRSPLPKKPQWRAWAANPEGITGDELLAFINGELFPALKELPAGGKPGDRRRVVRGVFEGAYNYNEVGPVDAAEHQQDQRRRFQQLAERQHFGDIYEQILNDLQSAGNAPIGGRIAPRWGLRFHWHPLTQGGAALALGYGITPLRGYTSFGRIRDTARRTALLFSPVR